MRALLFLLLALPCLASTPRQIAYQIEGEIQQDMADSVEGQYSRMPAPRLQARVDQAMNRALQVANEELVKQGYPQLARSLQHEWVSTYQSSMFALPQGIGAHKPLAEWLAKAYDSIENVLGKDFCLYSHIADIKTLNFATSITFAPCTFPMDGIIGPRNEEYKNHFCGKSSHTSEYYHGELPTIVYWVTYLGCDAATAGLGFMFVCGIGAGIGEQITSNEIAPGLSDDVYFHFCTNN